MRPLLNQLCIAASPLSAGTPLWVRNPLRRSRQEFCHLFLVNETSSDCNTTNYDKDTVQNAERRLWPTSTFPYSTVHFPENRPNSTIAKITASFRNQVLGNRDHRRVFSSRAKDPSESRRIRRSPYAVLGLGKQGRSSVTHDEIKAAFRRLAKVYHPDLNPENRPMEECETLMSELVDAYERLLRSDDEDDFLENIRVGVSNKVALACELYSVQELTMDNFHEVHFLQIKYETNEEENSADTELERGSKTSPAEDPPSTFLPQTAKSIVTPVRAHPGDSVLDLKERLESEFGTDWKLRDCLGWELLAFKKTKFDSEDPTIVAVHNEVLSYHLFLEDYQIQHGEVIYAVVRKHED